MKLVYLFLMMSFLGISQTTELNWSIFHPIKKKWLELGAKGSVQEALIQSGELPDPFVGMNEDKFAWIENYKWEFVSKLYLTEQQLKSNYLELEFPNVDTYAEIFVNGIQILKTENAFHPYSSQIKNILRLGYNEVKVIFTPPILYHTDEYKNEKYHLPATNDVHPTINIAPYTRKPQYQFGWDWALRMNTIGFWKPIVLHYYNESRITGKNCITKEISTIDALMDFELSFSTKLHGKITWKSHLFGEEIIDVSNESRIKRTCKLQNPILWWPRGQGEQHLYTDKWTLYNEKGDRIDEIYVSFGVRKAELINAPDEWGTSYKIKVNGRSIFCKGGDYIPQDMFPARVTDHAIIKIISDITASNFNMIRVWGGGYYPDEAFYDACDENGIMVWQDLMFACAMYPGDSSFLENVKQEFEYQIPRIASHASLILFNGNNEVEVAWRNWGFQKRYGIYGEDAKYIEESYRKLFKELAPLVIKSFTNSPYIHTSPLSNWGKDEFFNHGTMHYWGVWHGKDPIEDFGKKSGRFNAEYGFQSFPEFSTLNTFSIRADWNLDSAVMKHHQKSYVGNGMILKQTRRLFGEPKSFEEFVYLSQLTQSEAISIAIAGHRTGMPKCMGTLYWQINDCWQAPTWSSIDYFGNWKKLQYTVKEDYEDVAVLAKIQEIGKEDYYLVSDCPKQFICNLSYSVKKLNGDVILENIVEYQLEQGKVQNVFNESQKKELMNNNYVVHFEWNNSDGKKIERDFSHIHKFKLRANKQDIKTTFISNDTINKVAVLEIENAVFIQDFWVTSIKLGMTYSRNFIDCLPGKHQITIQYQDSIKLEDLIYYWR
ncbi:MAG: hypothetical protein HYR91_08855 [Flavobacteriia bacterium]|nr:hypothetical protein [Flavobacteriia bacterium]